MYVRTHVAFWNSLLVENWDRFKYEMISNIDKKESLTDARTEPNAREEKSSKKISFKDINVRTYGTPINEVPTNTTHTSNKGPNIPTYAQIASRTKNNKPMLII